MSSGSKENDELKRRREESPDVSRLDSLILPSNVFAESLKSNEYVEILMNCVKNLEREVKKLKDLPPSNSANQIKRERQLLELKVTVDFISNKFDDFERDRLDKEKKLKYLKERVTYLRWKVDDLTPGKNSRTLGEIIAC